MRWSSRASSRSSSSETFRLTVDFGIPSCLRRRREAPGLHDPREHQHFVEIHGLLSHRLEQSCQDSPSSPVSGTVLSMEHATATDTRSTMTTTWNIDAAHSGINFSIRHMVVSKVRGRFAKYTGAIQLDDGDLTRSSVEVDDRRLEHRHRHAAARRAPALGRLLRRREVSRAAVPQHAHRGRSAMTATA